MRIGATLNVDRRNSIIEGLKGKADVEFTWRVIRKRDLDKSV